MKDTVLVFALFILLGSTASCQVSKTSDAELEHFDSLSRSANEALLRKDFEEAERQFSEAASYAEKIDWVDGVVMSKRNLSGIRIARKNLEGAEQVLLEAKQVCIKDQKCSAGQLDSIFGHLLKFYAFRKKDRSRMPALVDEVIASRDRLAKSRPVEAILNSFADDLVAVGFVAEADEVRTRASGLANK